jgi:hypothetical protein
VEEDRLRVELDNKKALENEKKRRVSYCIKFNDSLVTNSMIFVGLDKGTSGRVYSEPRREGEGKTARVRDGENEGKGKEKSCHKGSCSLQRKSKFHVQQSPCM